MVVGSCDIQLLSIMHQLLDYDLLYELVSIICDNTSIISIYMYTVHHSKAKHINIKHHFIRDHVENREFVLNLFILKIRLITFLQNLRGKVLFLQTSLGIRNICFLFAMFLKLKQINF